MARPRKLNVQREPNGKPKRNVISAEVLFYRMRDLARDGASIERPDDALAGFTLGKLLLRWRSNKADGISVKQYEAGQRWSAIVQEHAKLMGYDLFVRSPRFEKISPGFDNEIEPDEDAPEGSEARELWIKVTRIKRVFVACYDALMAECKLHGINVRDVTYGVCVENWRAGGLSQRDFQDLRVGLNSLARVLS